MCKEFFPDGTIIDQWFYDYEIPALESLGKQYVITDYGVKDDGKIYTEEIQRIIDFANEKGGGVLVVPKGEYLTGALFFKAGVNLYLSEGATLKGSDFVTDYPVLKTRIEGETCQYLSALINADGVDGFTICGKGTIDGNGARSWNAFWHRRSWNPNCTNKDEQRPRLLYVSNSNDVTIAECALKNSHFWTTHIYKCNRVKYLSVNITSEKGKAPSTDAIDIDVCSDVHIKNCYFAVNDDAVVLKGGKGPDSLYKEENGKNERILVEDCEYGYCHGCLTCGSESIHNKNVIIRRVKINDAVRLMWFKLRPDTPQRYEFIRVEKALGRVDYMLVANPWTQFYDMKGHAPLSPSVVNNVTFNDCELSCKNYFNAQASEKYVLQNFTFNNLRIKTKIDNYKDDIIENLTRTNVEVNLLEVL